MIENILADVALRDNRALCVESDAGSTKGVFLPHTFVQSAEWLSEPPRRQVAWLRMMSYLYSQGLPLSGVRFPDSDGYWHAVCGLSAAEMHEPNQLWGFDVDGRLMLYADAEEVGV